MAYPTSNRNLAPTYPQPQALILPTPSMDRDGTMTIDWQEWRDHFLLHSLENVEDVLYFWKHSTVRQGWLPWPGSQPLPPPLGAKLRSPQGVEGLGQELGAAKG